MHMNLQPPSLLARLSGAVLAVVLALVGFFLVAGALAVGLVLAAGTVGWALLRGRRPGPVNLRWKTGRAPGAKPSPGRGEVIDIEVREVDETPRR